MNYLEVEILEEGINHLSKAIDCFADSELVSEEEFKWLEKFIDDLENRKIEAEIELKSIKMEVI